MRLHPILMLPLLLAACGEGGEYPMLVCMERNVQSGQCTKGEYTCIAPMVLKSTGSSQPRCYMPDVR